MVLFSDPRGGPRLCSGLPGPPADRRCAGRAGAVAARGRVTGAPGRPRWPPPQTPGSRRPHTTNISHGPGGWKARAVRQQLGSSRGLSRPAHGCPPCPRVHIRCPGGARDPPGALCPDTVTSGVRAPTQGAGEGATPALTAPPHPSSCIPPRPTRWAARRPADGSRLSPEVGCPGHGGRRGAAQFSAIRGRATRLRGPSPSPEGKRGARDAGSSAWKQEGLLAPADLRLPAPQRVREAGGPRGGDRAALGPGARGGEPGPAAGAPQEARARWPAGHTRPWGHRLAVPPLPASLAPGGRAHGTGNG